jgi:hypothetical protein
MSHPSTEQYREAQYELYQDKLSKMDEEDLLFEYTNNFSIKAEFFWIMNRYGREYIEERLLDKRAAELYEESLL